MNATKVPDYPAPGPAAREATARRLGFASAADLRAMLGPRRPDGRCRSRPAKGGRS